MKFFNETYFYPALAVTYGNALFGTAGIVALLYGEIKIALLLLIAAALCDVFDGLLARHGHQTVDQKKMGVIADTIADTVSFGVFPAVFLYVISHGYWPFAVISALYLVAVIHRLVVFSVIGEKEITKSRHFTGLPSIAIVIVLPLLYIATSGTVWVIGVGMVCMALLYVSRVRVVKPRGRAGYVGYIVTAALLIAGIAWS